MTFWPFRASTPPDTLGLGGDGDEIDLLEDVEKTFSIRFEQKDVEDLTMMGDLENLLAAKRGNSALSGKDWERLCKIAPLPTGNAGQIDRNTTLIAKFAQPREISNG